MAPSAAPPPAPVEDVLTRGGPTSRGWLATGAVLALATLTVVALGLVWRQYEEAKREATEELGSRADSGRDRLRHVLRRPARLALGDRSVAVRDLRRRRVDDPLLRELSAREGRARSTRAWAGSISRVGSERRATRGVPPPSASPTGRTSPSVIATKKPFVSEVIVGRTSDRRIVVMSVPTRDERGRLTGVLAGGLVLPPSRQDSRSTDLGYAGLEVLDREGQQITRRDLARPVNTELVSLLRARKQGVLEDTRGLDGSGGHVVAYASSAAPSWVAVIDQPASTVFADARRALRDRDDPPRCSVRGHPGPDLVGRSSCAA